MVLHEAAQRRGIRTGYLTCVESGHALFLFLDAYDHELFAPVLSAPYSLLLPAEDHLVHLGGAGYRVVAQAFHRLHHLALEGPAGLLPMAQLARKFRGGDALLVGGHEKDDMERHYKVELYHMEKRIRRGRFRIVATGTLTRPCGDALAGFPVTAPATAETVSLLKFRQIGKAVAFVGEPALKLEKGEALEFLLHNLVCYFPEVTTFKINNKVPKSIV